jgi:hypothetical protein
MTWYEPKTEQTFKDYYQILQLHPKVEAAIVDQAYWHLAQLYQDAARSDSSARAKLRDLNEAYTVLRSPSLRPKYDKVRDSILGKGAPPTAPPPKPEPLPLAVMAKQRPRPREDTGRPHPRRFRPSLAPFRVLPWRAAPALLAILAVASPALASGAHPALAIGLLSMGIAAAVLPLLRKPLGLRSILAPRKPKPHRSTNRAAPLLNESPTRTSIDTSSLRRYTDAIRAHSPAAADAKAPQPATLPEADLSDNPGHAPDDKDSAA